jgi:NCAIR mutase (PurE)-related protein
VSGEQQAGPGFEDLGFARVDTAREARQGLPEVVYGPGKTPAEVVAIVRRLLTANTGPVLVTRVDTGTASEVLGAVPGGRWDEAARLLVWRPAPAGDFRLCVVSAGTSDGPVAAEAAAVASAVGLRVEVIRDVGVAGLHRLLAVADDLRRADTVIVVAGMEGALASAVGGLVAAPVVAVPTSTGYGASLEGVTALLAMLSSCAAGLTVVNIDSGFSAAMAAFRLARATRRPA